MADPRIKPPGKRRDPLSPLMQAKRAANQGEVVNFCPFGCEDPQLDDLGYCGHLVGFTTDGRTMEPRVRRSDGRIIVSGKKKVQLQRGDQKVKVSTSARVYRRTPDPDLVVAREDDGAEMSEREEELQEALEQMKNPQLEGLFDGPSAYDSQGGGYGDEEDEELEKATRPKTNI